VDKSTSHIKLQLLYERAQRNLVAMRALREVDLPQLYEWSTSPDVARTWRYRGATPSFPMFIDQMFASTLSLYAFVCDSQLIGYGNLYDASLSAGHAHLSLFLGPENRKSTLFLSCFFAITDYAFDTWPLRKLYLECNSESIDQFKSAIDSGLLTEEARLVDYERSGRGTSDLIFLSFGRPEWMSIEP
jgi:RimJ/RimL family protein N-acetyltransferase